MDHLNRSGLVRPSDRVLAAYSGGADSTCMLTLLKEAGIDVVAGHLHHGQRSEADDEAMRCAQYAEELGVPFVRGEANVPQLGRDLKTGIEEAGRRARYAFLEKAAVELQCSLIATAHTRDDLVETMILNFARGAGVGGMAGIPARRGIIVRPMLAFDKSETRAFCMERNLWFHDDPANEDTRFSRARIRHRVVPELVSINPSFLEAATRLASIAEDEDRFLNGAAAAALEQTEAPLNGPLQFLTSDCEVAFSRSKLLGLPAVLLKRAMRMAAEVLGGPLDFEQTRALIQGLIESEKGALTPEGGTVAIEWARDQVHFRQLRQSEPFQYPLTTPGTTESPVFGWMIEAVHCDPGLFKSELDPLSEVLDPKTCEGALFFRSTEPGDSMRPLGLTGTKKVSDLLRESGLTLAARKRLPIICDSGGPVWIPGVVLADRVKVTEATRQALRVRFSPLESR